MPMDSLTGRTLMNHNIKTLERKFTLAELWELEKELRDKFQSTNLTYYEKKLIKEILGD
jgi:hypothetical protein